MPRRRRAAALLTGLVAVVVCPVAPPAGATTPHVADRLSFLHVGPSTGPGGLPAMLDDQGRTVLLRGVNVNGLEDYYQDSPTPTAIDYPVDPAAYAGGRCPARNPAVESVPVCQLDAVQLRDFGYNAVRLAVSWSLLEPQPGRMDPTELDRIAQVVGWLGTQGIYSVIDVHQDAWSKYIYTPSTQACPAPSSPVIGAHESDGAPLWASDHVAPVCYLGAREVDAAVQEDFQRLWSNVSAPDGTGLQEHLAGVLAALAARFHADPAVAGYEILNEPSPGFIPPPTMDATELFPFYGRVVAAMRHAAPDLRQLVFIEPNALRNVTDQRAEVGAWSSYSSYPNVVYAPHIYTHVFTPDGLLSAPALAPGFPVAAGYDTAASDARTLGLPLWDGEFGADIADDPTTLRQHYDSQDRLGVGGTLWVWKADGDATTGFSDLHGPFGPGVPYPSRLRFTDRAYPLELAGVLRRLTYDPDTARVTLEATAPGVAVGDRLHATVVYLPAASSGALSATGARLQVVGGANGAREAYLFPTGGDYRLDEGPTIPAVGGRTCRAPGRIVLGLHIRRGTHLLSARARVGRRVVGRLHGTRARLGRLSLDLRRVRGPRVRVRIVERVRVGRHARRVVLVRRLRRC